MKTIIYALGIIVLLLTFSSCTVEEILASSNNQTVLPCDSDIDPPIPAPKPM
ncbi:hypothetical protein [Flavobacterium sp.]|uniref:hypothetical protein n=1 Tax=Flavobacterium sp. TaxID=239 RepID=UPI003752EE8E